jgi:ABC-type sugar transport system substrate-binding protein
MRRRRTAVGVIVALSLALTSACGSDSESDSAAAPASSGSANAAAADAVKAFLAAPTSLPITTPLSRKPDAGKRLIVTENPQAVTRKTNDGLEKGAKLLGWTVKREQVGAGPEDPAKAFDSALDQKPDAVLVSGNPASTFRSQLERATREGIPVILSDAGDPVGQTGTAYTIGLDDFDQTRLWGKMTADYAASQNAKHVLVVDLSLYPILHAYSEGVVDELKKVAPNTKSTLIDTQIGDLVGGKIPANIVSEIQRNPDIDWVVLALGDMSTGLRAALRGAGLADKVKIGGESASTANVAALKSGDEDVWTGFAAEIHGMYRIDALARIFNKDPFDPAVYNELPTQIMTKDNVGSAPLDAEGYYVGIPDYVQKFSSLWKVSG